MLNSLASLSCFRRLPYSIPYHSLLDCQLPLSGWHLDKYDFVDGKYLFNRCHLIGYQLTGENANLSNLITGTRYMNIQGILPFENKTAGYIRSTGNHVMYRITPVFDGNNLVATGVLMGAYSVEDNGQ